VITLQYAQSQLDQWLAASTALSSSQEYRIGTRMVRRADANYVLDMIRYWERKVSDLMGAANGQGGTARFVTPDFRGCD
jgi:hypothetical protein